jgi:ubiquinone/menaquinone biosynthesis C-methylase UbiE
MSVMDRGFAAFYDLVTRHGEDPRMQQRRRDLLAEARGRVLEIGAGTGLNLPYFPDAVTELVLTEPSPHMVRRLRANLAGREARIVDAPAESLPFDDGAFDTVVTTLVLCSVEDPERAIAELQRVLAPGGKLLVLEHVRSRDPRLARWQDRVERPWRFIGAGCHPNRDTTALLASASGLETVRLEHGRLPKSPPPVRPLLDAVYLRR